eukprot:10004074-Alexandrium_andersonii.AAC.1
MAPSTRSEAMHSQNMGCAGRPSVPDMPCSRVRSETCAARGEVAPQDALLERSRSRYAPWGRHLLEGPNEALLG